VGAARPLAEEQGLTMAQLAIACVLQNDDVASAITGASRPDQVATNAQAAGHQRRPWWLGRRPW
jgi:aryl-alcohol dehydrogenase-like predicted oxidoreductase